MDKACLSEQVSKIGNNFMKTTFCLIGMAALLCGCATPPQAPLPTSMVYPASKNTVWPLLVSQIGLDYPVKAVEKDSGLLTTEFVNIPCGYGNADMALWANAPSVFLGTWDGLRMTLNAVAVESEPGKTQVTIRAHYEAFESNISKSWMVCESNGHLENQILTKISGDLAKTPTSSIAVPAP